MKKPLITTALVGTLALAACSEADVVSQNISTEADQFKVPRRVVFYNGITDTYMLTIEGYCSLGNNDKPKQLSLTCKNGSKAYKKHFLGLSDNVTYFVEQLEDSSVSNNHYKVIFRPQEIIPDIEIDLN